MIQNYFKAGYKAFEDDISVEDNPYIPDTEPYRSWEMGWHDAWYENTITNGDNF